MLTRLFDTPEYAVKLSKLEKNAEQQDCKDAEVRRLKITNATKEKKSSPL